MELLYVDKRLEENYDRIKDMPVTIFPYGTIGKYIREKLNSKWGIQAKYLVDNHSKDENVITLSNFLKQKDSSQSIIILSVEKGAYVRNFFGEMLQAGISAKSIVVINKNEIFGYEAAERVINFAKGTVLDIGCGLGIQGKLFADYGLEVTGLSVKRYDGVLLENVIEADFMSWQTKEQFDVVWMSHMLEHIRNIEECLLKVKAVVKEGGCLAITVPASEKEITLTHIHSFNAGRLLRYLIGAGFDCKNAEILVYGYNLSVIIPKVSFIPGDTDLWISEAAIEGYKAQQRLFEYFPKGIEIKTSSWGGDSYFNGDIMELNWNKDFYSIRL